MSNRTSGRTKERAMMVFRPAVMAVGEGCGCWGWGGRLLGEARTAWVGRYEDWWFLSSNELRAGRLEVGISVAWLLAMWLLRHACATVLVTLVRHG